MGLASTYLSAVAVGALTAGVAASNVVAVPPDSSESPEVALAAEIRIPIVDISPTVGPLTFSRLLALTLGNEPNLFGRLDSEAGSIWDFPRLATNFTNSSSGVQTLSAIRNPGESINFGFTSQGPQDSSWSLLGLAQGLTDLDESRSLNFTTFTGGSEGIGAGLGGTLADATVKRSLSVLDSGFTADSNRKVGDFLGELAFMPFDGFKAVGAGTLIDTGGDTDFKLGSLQVGGGGHGALSGGAGLCLGSAQGTESCGDQLAFVSVHAPVDFAVHTGDSTTNVISGNFSSNKLDISVKDRQLSVKGAVGGTFTVGSISIGQPIPIDFQIPNSPTMTLANNRQTVRDSFQAVPRNLASDNGTTGGRHRAPLRETIADVKTAVDNAVHPKHAAED